MIRHAPLLLVALLLGALPARAQEAAHAAVPLEVFVQQVTHLWSQGDVGGLLELAAEDGRVLLDTGSGTATVNSRHAAAALRALFSDRESVSTRPVRVTLAGGTPVRGFGEVSWTYRSRGAPSAQTRSLYVGAVSTGKGWRLTELRILP